MTAPDTPSTDTPAWPLPSIWRVLPADISDDEFMRVTAEMQQEIRDTPGVPANLVKAGVTPLDDGRWLAQAWQATSQFDWTIPPVDPDAVAETEPAADPGQAYPPPVPA